MSTVTDTDVLIVGAGAVFSPSVVLKDPRHALSNSLAPEGARDLESLRPDRVPDHTRLSDEGRERMIDAHEGSLRADPEVR